MPISVGNDADTLSLRLSPIPICVREESLKTAKRFGSRIPSATLELGAENTPIRVAIVSIAIIATLWRYHSETLKALF